MAIESARAEPGALHVRNLRAGYGRRVVLDGIDLAVGPGELMVLIGANGAGKSTLFRALSSGADVLAGSATVGEANLLRLDPRARARIVAVVPQALDLPEGIGVAEMVLLGRTPHASWWGGDSDDDWQVVHDAMRATDVANLAERDITEVSGGERQRVLLARALAQEPRLLLLDEATAHLDLRFQIEIFTLVRRLAAGRGFAVLASCHDLDLAARFADRIAVLHDRRLTAVGEPGEVLTKERVEEAFGVEVEVSVDPRTGRPRVLPSWTDEDA